MITCMKTVIIHFPALSCSFKVDAVVFDTVVADDGTKRSACTQSLNNDTPVILSVGTLACPPAKSVRAGRVPSVPKLGLGSVDSSPREISFAISRGKQLFVHVSSMATLGRSTTS